MHIFGLKLIPWDLPFAIAAFTLLTKIFDNFLNKDQKKWVQDRMDAVTVMLDDIRPLRWFRILQNRKVQLALAWTGACITAALLMFFTILVLKQYSDLPEASYGIATVAASLLLSVFLFKKYGLNRCASPLIGWLYAEAKFDKFLFRFVKFVAIYFALSFVGCLICLPPAYLCGFLAGRYHVSETVNIMLFISGMALAMVVAVFQFFFNVVVLAGLIVIGAQMIVFAATIVIRLLGWLGWKIVEWDKGPVVGISALLTAALGIVAAYFHVRSGP